MPTLRSVLARTLIALPAVSHAQQQSLTVDEYSIDVGHSIVEFSIPFAFTRVKGRFTDWRGTMLYDRSNPANSSISVVMESKSIDTGWPHRDEHLRTSDFFDVERFPRIIFQSDKIRTTPSGWVADGKLTMHGVMKSVSLPFQVATGAPQRSPDSGWLILNAMSTIALARADFGIAGGSKYNSWFDAARAATMGDSVAITLEIQGWFADTASERNAAISAAVTRVKNEGVKAQIDRLRQARDSALKGRTLTGTPGPAWPAYYHGLDLTVRALVAEGRASDAVTLAGGMTSLFTTWSTHMLHGYALAAAGDDREASAAFARAKASYTPPPPSNEKFKQDDEDWWQLNQLALSALARGQRRPALEVARVLAEIYPSFSRAFVTLGRAQVANGDERAARASYSTALRLDPYETRALEWSRRVP